MTLDRDHALSYLHGDSALLQQLLKMFSGTLIQLQDSLSRAQALGQGNTQHRDWQTFYRALHGANPTLLVICAAPLRELVSQVCNALAANDFGAIQRLTDSLALAFVQLAGDVEAASGCPSAGNQRQR